MVSENDTAAEDEEIGRSDSGPPVFGPGLDPYLGEHFFDVGPEPHVTDPPLQPTAPISPSLTIPVIPAETVPTPIETVPTPIDLPDRPLGDFVTPIDMALALADMIELTRRLIRDALQELRITPVVEGFVSLDTFQAVLRDQALVNAARVELVDAMFATQSERFQSLESLIATTLLDIENRRLAEIAEVEEVTGFSPMTIFTGLGDFMRDPVDYVLEKSRDQILEEISIGLNR